MTHTPPQLQRWSSTPNFSTQVQYPSSTPNFSTQVQRWSSTLKIKNLSPKIKNLSPQLQRWSSTLKFSPQLATCNSHQIAWHTQRSKRLPPIHDACATQFRSASRS